MTPIKIAVGDVSLEGQLNDTAGGRALAGALPLKSEFRVWGDELHFPVPVALDAGTPAAPGVEPGDLGLWAAGQTLCIFFGPTPLSVHEKPIAAVPVRLVGRIDDAELLRAAKESNKIVVEAVG